MQKALTTLTHKHLPLTCLFSSRHSRLPESHCAGTVEFGDTESRPERPNKIATRVLQRLQRMWTTETCTALMRCQCKLSCLFDTRLHAALMHCQCKLSCFFDTRLHAGCIGRESRNVYLSTFLGLFVEEQGGFSISVFL